MAESPGNWGKTSISNARRFSLAPMMDWTDTLIFLLFLPRVGRLTYSVGAQQSKFFLRGGSAPINIIGKVLKVHAFGALLAVFDPD